MNLHELSRYYNLKQRLDQDIEILESLKQKASPGTSALTGMPHSPGVNDKVSYLATEIAYMEDQINQLHRELEEERIRLEEIINQIDDPRVNVICRLRFLRCMTWVQVADCLGPYYTGTGARKILVAYMSKQEHPDE